MPFPEEHVPSAGEPPEPLPPGVEGEPEAWAAVEAGWAHDAAHRAYLARFVDLEGLAVAGGRYREALRANPDDLVARRWRDEVLKRATAAGLAQLPRTSPDAVARRATSVRRIGVAAVVAAVLGFALLFGGDLLSGLRGLLE